jgi:hypothetical protein
MTQIRVDCAPLIYGLNVSRSALDALNDSHV